MFCQKCGNQLNEGAAFCPKCGTRIDVSSGIRVQAVDGNKVKPLEPVKPQKSKRGIIIASIIFAICLLCFLVKALGGKNVNAGKGADDPIAIGKSYVLCCQYRDTSYIDKYLDEELNSDSFIEQIQGFIQFLDEQNFGDINMDGVTYKLGATYEEEGFTCVDITINFAEKGLFGGNTIFGNSGKAVISLHKAKTPDGIKWFFGKQKAPRIIEDESGLMESQ